MKGIVMARGVNPQEATIPEENDEDLSESPLKNKDEHADASSLSKGRNNCSRIPNPKKKENTPLMRRRKRRNRVAYMANVNGDRTCSINDDSMKQPPTIPLPLNHYVTTLVRRAIRKREGDSAPPSPQQAKQTPEDNNKEDDEEEIDNGQEEYGDISLGMKLSVVSGKVIVQQLNALLDGRASPAQIVGVIQRGDILLSIDHKSLVNLPIDLMMERLKPLSTPDSTGAYQGILQLRLAAGEGLEMLIKSESRKPHVSSNEAASEVFSLFPMADQLSGMPLFDSHIPKSIDIKPQPATPSQVQQHPPQHQEEKKQTEEEQASPSTPKCEAKDQKGQSDKQQEKPLDEIISRRVAEWRSSERNNFTSEYYAWDGRYSELLRPSEGNAATMTAERKGQLLTKTEMLEVGHKALLGAENLSRAMENMDRGKDMRSFKSWNASISLRSGASTRRRYVLDAASLPVMRPTSVKLDMKSPSLKGPNAGVSLASGTTSGGGSDMDDVDGDALLLHLAAHDEIWRSQVIDALKNARDKVADGAVSEESEDEDDEASNDDMGALGAFLFGETLAKVVTKKKKSKALPPDEITAVLFDLSTHLASTMPDEVAVGDGTVSGGLKSSLVPFFGRKNPEAGSSVILATRFVLDEALAVWLETFRPLPWESRRVLWPEAKLSTTAGEDHGTNMFSDNDSLTIDSGTTPTTAYTSTTNGNNNQSKDLRQQIEDQQLDVETRAETCFLVTYYFTHRLLPKLAPGRTSDDTKASQDLVAFVRKYGAYMKLHTCMAYAAALKCADAIDELLALAEHDLRHREVIKLFYRRHALILYEPTMLSAVVKCLPIISEEKSAERRQVLVDVCVSAYPDLCPWQVQQALVEEAGGAKNNPKRQKQLKNLYYYYLSSLLHPQDGHEAARQDAALVEEWCHLSLDANSLNDEPGANSRRENFLSVASLNSSDHLSYHRDLSMLIKLSMSSYQFHLALDLANEIINNSNMARDERILALVLEFLRDIAHDALKNPDQHEMFRTLKRVVRLFQQMSKLSGPQCFSFADELHGLLEFKERQRDRSNKLLELVHFVAQEAPPSDFLQTFNTWTSSRHEWLHDSIAVLQAVLRRGTRVALNAELSGSMLRLRRARQRMQTSLGVSGSAIPSKYQPEGDLEEPTLWSLMSKGLVAIDK